MPLNEPQRAGAIELLLQDDRRPREPPGGAAGVYDDGAVVERHGLVDGLRRRREKRILITFSGRTGLRQPQARDVEYRSSRNVPVEEHDGGILGARGSTRTAYRVR